MQQHIRESNLIESIDDPAFDKQGRLAWDYISAQSKLDRHKVTKLQDILTALQDDLEADERGCTRGDAQVNVTVGGRVAPAWQLVDPLLDNWLLDMQTKWKSLDPLAMHVRFEKIHPFVDGNGRTGRMLMWWHEKKLGRGPTLFLNSTKFEQYYPLFA